MANAAGSIRARYTTSRGALINFDVRVKAPGDGVVMALLSETCWVGVVEHCMDMQVNCPKYWCHSCEPLTNSIQWAYTKKVPLLIPLQIVSSRRLLVCLGAAGAHYEVFNHDGAISAALSQR
jgi:hypothetical protein